MSLRFSAYGPLGSGKTMDIVKEAFRYFYQHKTCEIISNIWIDMPFTKLTNMEEIFTLERGNKFLLLDEFWKEADSRKSQSAKNEILSIFLIRSRKYHWTIGYSEQFWRQIDIRIRYITDLWMEPQMWLRSHYLQEEIFNPYGEYITERWYDATKLWPLFKTDDPPYTFEAVNLLAQWQKATRR
jgi:hypothetical protein